MPAPDVPTIQFTADDYAQADRDLGQQGLPGSLLYTAIWLLVIGVTSLAADHPALAWSGLLLLTLPGGVRLLLGLRFDHWYPRNPHLWRRAYWTSVICLAAVWGLLVANLIWHYHAAWPAMMASFATAGIVAGGTISLSTHRRLQQAYIITLLLPPALAGLATADGDAMLMGMLFALNIAFLLTIGVKLDRSYWENLGNLRLLKQRATELEEARARAEDADRAKGQFVAKVSHELRTPLNGLIGTLDMLRQTDVPARRARYQEIMSRSADLLLQRINELLDFSKMEAGKLTLESIPMCAADVVRDCVSLLQDSAQAKGLTLRADLPPAPPDCVTGDPGRLTQVLLNLVANAIKFTPRGTVVVSLRQQRPDPDHVRCTFVVEDPGIGIPADAQARIFDSFAQADDSTTREYGGTGLGLAVSHDLVRLMGGELGVDSEPGRGSRFAFTLTLPFADRPLPAAQAAGGAVDAGANPTLGLRVLLAEDNPINQVIMQEMLEMLGCSCDVVGDGQACIDRYHADDFDVILMDCDMPGVDGCEAAQRIAAENPGGDRPDVPIIAVTAFTDDSNRRRARDAGMQGFITKPFVLEDLNHVLGTLAPRVADRG
ncbi:MAG: ATP-binding protein [Gammaproteobacteria bacterium]|nr:ATP-binding protein [Gammaproteobacteria bacterium]